MSDSLWPNRVQCVRLPCPSLSPRVCSNACPLSRWCHPIISSSVVPSSFCLQSFPASGSFPVSQFFASGGQIIGVSAPASVLPVNIQDWFSLGLTGLVSLLSKGVKSSAALQFESITSSMLSLLCGPTLTSLCDYWENHSFDYMDLLQQYRPDVCFLICCLGLYNFSHKKQLSFNLMAAVIKSSGFQAPPQMKSVIFHFFPISLPWNNGTRGWKTPSSNNTREDSTHGHHQMVNIRIRLIILFAAKHGEAL